ncbi:uncharacterized protein [Pseudorca crassidens]|uniref:uncharacterized protein isoform X1 n=1 Tax=Pseudorca crassidens TaxID=82174 RepID=UPI00352CAA57
MPRLRNEDNSLMQRGAVGSRGCQVGGPFGRGDSTRRGRAVPGAAWTPGLAPLSVAPPQPGPPGGGWGAVFLFRPLPCNAKALGPAHSAPKRSNQLSGRKGARGRGSRRCQKQPPPAQHAQRSLWGSGCCRQTLGQTDSWTLGLTMRLSGGQSSLLTALLPLLTCLHLGMSLANQPGPCGWSWGGYLREHISYAPQLSGATLAGRLTQPTFTLEQPRCQFSHLNVADFDTIWLVLAHSNEGGGHPGPCQLAPEGLLRHAEDQLNTLPGRPAQQRAPGPPCRQRYPLLPDDKRLPTPPAGPGPLLPRHSRLPQGPRARAPWSSLPSCRSCWPSSSPPSSPCSSTPAMTPVGARPSLAQGSWRA